MAVDEISTLELKDPEGPQQAGPPCIRWLHQRVLVTTELRQARVVLGRGRDCDVQLEAAGVSRRHAEIFRQGPVCALADLESKNGVFVNGRAVTHATLSVGDVIRLGDAIGVVDRGDAPDCEAELRALGVAGSGMARALGELARIAPSNLPVVVIGETGVGKERAAQVIHALSRRVGPLHSVNCAAIPENLAEAELFGHRKGAFTGAESAGLGHFRAAHQGTLFLDEVQDLPNRIQASILRALQEQMVTPVGETRAHPVDVRVIAASQSPLDELVEAKRIRADLVMRLSGFVLHLPPLRERRADIGELFRLFIEAHCHSAPTIEVRCLEDLLLYDWPGNVRELEFLARRLAASLDDERSVRWQHLPDNLRRAHAPRVAPSVNPPANRDEHDANALREALRQCGGNVSRAAAMAGISRQRAYRLLDGRSAEEFLAER